MSKEIKTNIKAQNMQSVKHAFCQTLKSSPLVSWKKRTHLKPALCLRDKVKKLNMRHRQKAQTQV